MKNIIIIILVFIWNTLLNSQGIYNSVESRVYDICASSLTGGLNSLGGNTANLNFDKREGGVQYNSWLGDIFLTTAQYGMPTFNNKKLRVASSINIGYISSGKIEERDENATLLQESRYSQFVMTVLNSIDIKYIVLGVGVNYLTKDSEEVCNNDVTFDFGVKYEFEYSDNISIVIGFAANNIMSDANNYILPKNIDNSIGLIYYDDENEDLEYGIGVGYLSVLESNKVGISLFYENLVGITQRAKFKLRVFGTYSYNTDEAAENDFFKSLKFGIKMDFSKFKIVYGFRNFGYAGVVSSIGLNFNI